MVWSFLIKISIEDNILIVSILQGQLLQRTLFGYCYILQNLKMIQPKIKKTIFALNLSYLYLEHSDIRSKGQHQLWQHLAEFGRSTLWWPKCQRKAKIHTLFKHIMIRFKTRIKRILIKPFKSYLFNDCHCIITRQPLIFC